MVKSPSISIRDLVVDQIAYARGRTRDFILAEIEAAGGDLVIDSKAGEAIASRAEVLLGLPQQIRTEKQDRRQLTSLTSLTRLIARRRAHFNTAPVETPGGGV